MNRYLVWDTSSKVGSICVFEGLPDQNSSSPRLLTEWTLNVDAVHSEQLLWGIHQALKACQLEIEQVDGFGVGIGPGSFTGLRIGLTTARTLAHSLKKPLLGISSLSALARPTAEALVSFRLKNVLLVVANDAAKGEFFVMMGKPNAFLNSVSPPQLRWKGMWDRTVFEGSMAPDVLVREVKKRLARSQTLQWVALGESVERYPQIFDELPQKRRLTLPSEFTSVLQGRALMGAMWQVLKAGYLGRPLEIHPRYLRASAAEIKLQAGLLPRGPTRR